MNFGSADTRRGRHPKSTIRGNHENRHAPGTGKTKTPIIPEIPPINGISDSNFLSFLKSAPKVIHKFPAMAQSESNNRTIEIIHRIVVMSWIVNALA
jgi:hypothetical protein